MKTILTALSLLACFGASVCAQEKPPQLLLHAAQCLKAKNFLPSSKAAVLTLGHVLDERSYPGDKVIYVVSYVASGRLRGDVFAVFVTEQDGGQHFNIQNNASFVLSKQELSGVAFVNPPLGGTWTQEHIASAIKQSENEPEFAIPVKNLSPVAMSVSCEAYSDPERKGDGETRGQKPGDIHDKYGSRENGDFPSLGSSRSVR